MEKLGLLKSGIIPSCSFIFLVMLLSSFSCKIYAAEIDLPKALAEKIPGSHAAELLDSLNEGCATFPVLGAKLCKEIELQNIRITDAKVNYSDVKVSPLPDAIFNQSYLFRNCSSDVRKDSRSLTIVTHEGVNVVTLDNISKTSGTTATLNVEGVQLGATDSHQISLSESKAHDFTKTVTETVNFEETIKPYTALLVKIEKRVSNAYLDFEGDILADADIYFMPCCGFSGTKTFTGSYDVLVGEHRFKLRGQMWNAKAQTTTKSISEVPLSKDNPLHCPAVPLAGKEHSKPQKKEYLSNLFFDHVEGFDWSKNAPQTDTAAQRIVPLISGMTITTADVIANVEVRAKSLGSGMCGVIFNTSGGTTQFLSPPHSWSPWTNLVSHIGKASFTITNDILCDTGIVAELRYYE